MGQSNTICKYMRQYAYQYDNQNFQTIRTIYNSVCPMSKVTETPPRQQTNEPVLFCHFLFHHELIRQDFFRLPEGFHHANPQLADDFSLQVPVNEKTSTALTSVNRCTINRSA